MKITKLITWGIIVPSFSFAANTESAKNIDNHFPPKMRQENLDLTLESSTNLIPGTFQQPIDHAASGAAATFGQRYWFDSEYAAGGGDAPVLYHICGEGDVDQSYFLNDNAIAWAKTLGAHLVYLEHRYYGKSLPFSDLSSEHMRFLTLDNVLEDLATFQKWMSTQQGWKGKWISVGGSYSGTLSALYRQKHPELIVGALASSAPMIAGVGQTVDSDDGGDLSSTDPSSDSGARQWVYQACRNFGFWQADGGTPDSNLEIPGADLCRQLFGADVPLVDPATYNKDYDMPFISSSSQAPSNILFTYGSNDVWTNIGLSQQKNSNARISILVIDGAGHHFDLNAPGYSDSAAVINARNTFVQSAQRWLGAAPTAP